MTSSPFDTPRDEKAQSAADQYCGSKFQHGFDFFPRERAYRGWFTTDTAR
ncbi:MAG: hypothetical protein ACJ74Y_08420 [Bryobacteraceae bacterium]